MDLRIQCLCIDTADPAGLAGFWQAALGWRRTHDEDDEVVLEPPQGSPEDGIAPDLLFLRVPEDKAGKNRLHLDLRPYGNGSKWACPRCHFIMPCCEGGELAAPHVPVSRSAAGAENR